MRRLFFSVNHFSIILVPLIFIGKCSNFDGRSRLASWTYAYLDLILISNCRYDVMLARFRDSDPRHVHDSAPDSI